jgi:hypothetical protein
MEDNSEAGDADDADVDVSEEVEEDFWNGKEKPAISTLHRTLHIGTSQACCNWQKRDCDGNGQNTDDILLLPIPSPQRQSDKSTLGVVARASFGCVAKWAFPVKHRHRHCYSKVK